MTAVTLRPLTTTDLETVGELLRLSFEPRLRPYLTVAQHGWTTYAQELLTRAQGRNPYRHLVVAEIPGISSPVGYMDIETPPDAPAFLSYISVNDRMRGAGIGTMILRSFFSTCTHTRGLELDVFGSNFGARRLYSRLGLADLTHSDWWVGSLQDQGDGSNWDVIDPGPALADLNARGFCFLRLARTQGGLDSVRLGVIGTSLQCFGLEDFVNGDLHRAVRQYVPHLRDTLFVQKDVRRPGISKQLRATGAHHLVRSIRMGTSTPLDFT